MKTIDRSFDLNSLRVLVALFESRNVTRAAESLDMSQSGFSTALAKLRAHLGDPLFVRTRAGMEATQRAADIVDTARRLLADVQENILEQPVFRPEEEKVEFRLSMADLAEVVFLPRLVAHLAKVAPFTTLSTESMRPEPLRTALEAGQIDVALGYFPDLETGAIYKQKLYNHSYACILRVDHPLKKSPLTKEAYSALGHAVVMSPARTNDLFERFLDRKKIRRNVVVHTPHHLSLPSIVAASDLIASVPLATAQYFANLGEVAMVPLPFVPPVFAVQQQWHHRSHKDVRATWLRQQVALLFNDSTDIWLKTECRFYGSIRGRVA